MKKKVFIIVSIFGIIILNIYFTNALDVNSEIEIKNIEMIAKAESEGDVCWTNMQFDRYSKVLECNDPCCWKSDYLGVGDGGGLCDGRPYANCP